MHSAGGRDPRGFTYCRRSDDASFFPSSAKKIEKGTKKGGKEKKAAEVNKERDEPVKEQILVNKLCGCGRCENTSWSPILKAIDHRIYTLQGCFTVRLVPLQSCW